MTCAAYESANTFSAEHFKQWTWISPKQFAKAHLSRYMSVFQPLEAFEPDDADLSAVVQRPAITMPAVQDPVADFYVVKDGDSIWSIAREIVDAQADCIFDPEVRRQDTRRVALAIAQAYGVFHPDSVELSPGAKIHVAIQLQGVAARRAS